MAEQLLAGVLVWALPVLLAVAGHEVAHGLAARELGDDTAARLGRLSLNPLRHVDPIGTVLVPAALLFLHSPYLFGWARPVPVNWRRLRRPRRDMALVALAGPAANVVMLSAWILLGVALSVLPVPGGRLLIEMVRAGIIINSLLIVVNLVPIPPLDGSRAVSALLPPPLAAGYNRFEKFGLLIVLALLLTGALGTVLNPILRTMVGLSLGALG